jgi:hydrogenase nickel incorporation protein HypA/HybF
LHEFSIVQDLLDNGHGRARDQGAIKVHRIHLRIGEISGVEIDLLASAFEICRENTLCAGAELEIQPIPPAWACPTCGGEVRPGEILSCAQCGVPARLLRGDEIVLERIEMEVG